MTITKSIEFFAPYIANTFNEKDDALAGTNGLLGGAEVTIQTSTTVDIAAYTFVQNGLIVRQDEATLAVVVPDFAVFTGPVHIILSSPDEKVTSGVTVTVSSGNSNISSTAVVVASRVNDVWTNPPGLDLRTLREHALLVRADVAPGGVVKGAELKYASGFGTPQGIRVGPGVASESDGSRRVLQTDPSISVSTGPAAHIELDIANVDPDFARDTHLVLRKVADGRPAELTLVKGETIEPNGRDVAWPAPTASLNVDTTAGNTAPVVSNNAIGESVVVWSNASDLKLRKLAHDTARTGGAISTQAMGALTTEVYITAHPNLATGDRLFGLASVGAATAEEIFLFRTTADGAAIDATTVALTTTVNSALSGHMVIDENNFAHLVYQHDESGGGVNNQIFYAKYNLADASWDTAPAVAVAPRFARGFNSGQNDTDPRIGIDSTGNLHIAFTRGTSPAVVGDIVYLVIDQTGATVEAENVINTSVSDGAGAAIVRADHAKARVAVSPQSDVYIAYLAELPTGKPYLRIFERTLLERTGFKSVEVSQIFTTVPNTNEVDAMDAFTDDMGRLDIFILLEDITATTGYFLNFKFDAVIMSDGVQILPDILTKDIADTLITPVTGAGYPYATDGVFANFDSDGSLQAVELIANAINHRKWSSQPVLGSSSVYEGSSNVSTGKVHPKDTYLATIAHDIGVANLITPSALNQVRRRREVSRPPYTAVGLDGDFAGYLGLHQAVNSLKGKGGRVIIRGGYHRITHKIRLWSGIEVVGDGHVVLDVTGVNIPSAPIAAAGFDRFVVVTTDPAQRQHSLAFASIIPDQQGMRPGDAIFLYDDVGTKPAFPGTNYFGPYYITDVLQDGGSQVYINSATVTSIVSGMTQPQAIWYSTGIRLSNVTIQDSAGAGNAIISLNLLSNSELDNVVISTLDAVSTITHEACNGMRYSGCDIGADSTSLDLDGNARVLDIGTVINDCRFVDDVFIGPSYGFHRLKVSGSDCEGTWTLSNVTDVPVWTNNGGTIVDTTFDGVASWGDGGTQFTSTLKFNQNAAAITAGHVIGEMVPTTDGQNAGTFTKRWNLKSRKINLSSEASGEGLIGTTSVLTDQVSPLNNFANIHVDAGGSGSLIIEANGRIAKPHRFFDDFLYNDGVLLSEANLPLEYGYTTGGGTATIFQLSPGDLGGVIVIQCDGTSSMGLNGMNNFLCRPTLDRRITAFFRAALTPLTVGTVADLKVFNSGTNKTFGFTYDDANKWRGYTEDVAGTRTYSATLTGGTSGVYYNFSLRTVDDNTVEFWKSGGSARVTVTAPQTFTSIGSSVGYGLQADVVSTFGNSDAIRLDAWEIQETLAMSGNKP